MYTCDFEVATLSATKIASSCCEKNRLCKRALSYIVPVPFPKNGEASNILLYLKLFFAKLNVISCNVLKNIVIM